MGRVTDALLKNTAYARGSVNPILDLQYGGQMGYAPNYNEWVSNAAYVPRNLICLLLEAPEFFQRMKEPEKWTQCLRSMVELHAKSIDGLNATLQVDVDDSVSVVGGGGEVQEEFTNVKRNRSNPRFTFVEKYGKPMQMFFYNWITHGIMDPESNIDFYNLLKRATLDLGVSIFFTIQHLNISNIDSVFPYFLQNINGRLLLFHKSDRIDNGI